MFQPIAFRLVSSDEEVDQSDKQYSTANSSYDDLKERTNKPVEENDTKCSLTVFCCISVAGIASCTLTTRTWRLRHEDGLVKALAPPLFQFTRTNGSYKIKNASVSLGYTTCWQRLT